MDKGRDIDELRAIVGSRHVLDDPETTARYRVDWTGRFGGRAAVVVRPGSTAEVAAVASWVAERHIPLVTQGGNTGLVGGSVPTRDGAVVLTTERLHHIDDLDLDAGQVTAGAGVTLAALADRLRGTGWRFAVDLGARGSATIGGMVATNAGGVHVFRFGSMRAQLLGLDYVTAAGEVVSRLGGLQKDNTGYDLTSLICGSEGTVAVVTAARLRLIRAPSARATAMAGFGSARAARAAAWMLRRTVPDTEVIEYVSGDCLELVATTYGITAPVVAPHALLVEAAADLDPSDVLASAIDALGSGPAELAPLVVAVATDTARRAALWRFRDDITAALATLGPVVKYDVSLRGDEIDAFRADAETVIGALAPGARAWWFGHVCDDNLHLNVTGAPTDDSRPAALDAAIFQLIAAHRGSISAEHGIGRAKVNYLHLARSPVEIAQMRSIKAALDPSGILNPGVLLSS